MTVDIIVSAIDVLVTHTLCTKCEFAEKYVTKSDAYKAGIANGMRTIQELIRQGFDFDKLVRESKSDKNVRND